jgi:diacylglycerol kinase family enzyme
MFTGSSAAAAELQAAPDTSAITVVLNPVAASSRGRIAEIARLFSAAGLDAEIVETGAGRDPAADAARAVSAHASVVVAAGGDGTVSRVAAGVVGTGAALGVLPLGTLNHFAKDVGIPLDLRKAVDVIARRHVRRIDAAQVNDRVFVNNSSIGIYPSIVEQRDELRHRGYPKWPAFAVATFRVLRQYRGVHVRMTHGDRLSTWRTPFVFVGNNEYVIDGWPLGTRLRMDGGQLFAYLAPRTHTRALPLLFARALAGRGRRSGEFQVVSSDELWIDTPRARRIRVSLDGETMVMRTPLHYRICPGALTVVVPAE